MNCKELKTIIEKSERIVGFTGAGISTESGIADYRGHGGVWTQYRVVTLQEFLVSNEGRCEYWQRKADLWDSIRNAQPNTGHMAFARLNESGKLLGLITQNIDGLHKKAGLPDDKIVKLHGDTTITSCLECKHTITTDQAVAEFRLSGAPVCQECGGWMKPATISFGQSMPEAEMARASQLCLDADIFIAAGSSLAVQPAANFPVIAKQNGATLIIINRNETALDNLADILIHDEIDNVLPKLF